MNRRIVLLNILLLAVLLWIGWMARSRWMNSEELNQSVLAKRVTAAEQMVPPPVPGAPQITPADYIDVAQQTLFSADRDPNVIIQVEEPPPPPPPPERPALPIYYGQMAFAKPVILLGINDEPQKSFALGERVGDFELLDFDRDTIRLDWNGEEITASLADLRAPVDAEPAPSPSRRARRVTADGSVTAAPARSSIGSMGKSATKSGAPEIGPQAGLYRSCLASDTSPAGTIKDGYRKVVNTTLMGAECHWEAIE